ncbi:uncharacterized protein EV422DRAFT_229626 [Fimicolochytrium jonesii]|uniref:uncharacterized protein n=1 Tax=Fimicolochytrium jonesii TaxID=1396493 RepID=UPI0022FDD868|nr:uncharacterized protein EV422DRAFT_229626 [Fimicolochytrium jonesii]KAI8817262.1 hypothetical protein EV422DRAFT_229626 [Fimicolochytrium jonesii]
MSAPALDLPPHWVAQWDPTYERNFYVDTQTGHSQWEPPVMPTTTTTVQSQWEGPVLPTTTSTVQSLPRGRAPTSSGKQPATHNDDDVTDPFADENSPNENDHSVEPYELPASSSSSEDPASFLAATEIVSEDEVLARKLAQEEEDAAFARRLQSEEDTRVAARTAEHQWRQQQHHLAQRKGYPMGMRPNYAPGGYPTLQPVPPAPQIPGHQVLYYVPVYAPQRPHPSFMHPTGNGSPFNGVGAIYAQDQALTDARNSMDTPAPLKKKKTWLGKVFRKNSRNEDHTNSLTPMQQGYHQSTPNLLINTDVPDTQRFNNHGAPSPVASASPTSLGTPPISPLASPLPNHASSGYLPPLLPSNVPLIPTPVEHGAAGTARA